MKKHPVEKRFFFHANAVALAAQIRRPEEFLIPAVASSCLPVTGGVGKATTAGERFGEILSYSSASTSVSGDFIDTAKAADFTHGNHGDNDLATATHAESQLNVLRMANGGHLVEIAKLEAKMSSFSDRQGATEFRTMSAEFDQVRIDGVGLQVVTHCEIFTRLPTKLKLTQEFSSDAAFRDRYGACFFSATPGSRKRRMPEADGLIYATVVTSLNWEGNAPEGAVVTGNSVKIAGFGSVYFGEILIEESFRRLTMLRFELGSACGGTGSVAEIQANGSSWPPR
jgi:hypothetical protein